MNNPQGNKAKIEEAQKLLDGNLLAHMNWILRNPVESAIVIGQEDVALIIKLAQRLDAMMGGVTNLADTTPLSPEEMVRISELRAIHKERKDEMAARLAKLLGDQEDNEQP